MMINRGEWDDNRRMDRGASELLGYTLLIGMVLIVAGMVAFLGTPILQGTHNQQAEKSTEMAMGEVNTRLGELSRMNLKGTTDFTFEGTDEHIEGEPLLKENTGHLKITVNQNATCSKKIPLDSIRIRTENGEHLVYEGGGIWRHSSEEGLEKVSSPSVNFQNGTLDIEIKNLTGTVSTSTNEATINRISSKNDTEFTTETLLQGDCRRPDNITVEVESELHLGWAQHFKRETGYQKRNSAPATDESYLEVNEKTNTTTVYLNQDTLPPETDDERNQVIDVTDKEEYMENVNITTDGISVDKNIANREYHVYVEPVGPFNIEILENMSEEVNASRPPIDTIIVLDRSASMREKGIMGIAKNTIKQYSGYMTDGYDRVGVIGFTRYKQIFRTNDKVLTYDLDAFNNTVDDISGTENGGTFTTVGMKASEAQLRLQSGEYRDEIIILLSDGQNWGARKITVGGEEYDDNQEEANEGTVKVAEIANKSGTTVHTVGWQLNADFLKNTSKAGGGNFYQVGNADELKDAFEDIADNTRQGKVVSRPPIATNISAGNVTKPPEFVEDPEYIANVTNGTNTWFNVNDPTGPDGFSHRFKIGDGEMVNFSATTYGCDKWSETEREGIVDDGKHPIVRCTAMNESEKTIINGKDNVTVYTNEDSSEFSKMLDNTETNGDQRNLTERLENRGLYNESTRELTMKSNQVLVMYDFRDGEHSDNRMLMLYTVGYPHSYQPDGIIDIDIANIKIEA